MHIGGVRPIPAKLLEVKGEWNIGLDYGRTK